MLAFVGMPKKIGISPNIEMSKCLSGEKEERNCFQKLEIDLHEKAKEICRISPLQTMYDSINHYRLSRHQKTETVSHSPFWKCHWFKFDLFKIGTNFEDEKKTWAQNVSLNFISIKIFRFTT